MTRVSTPWKFPRREFAQQDPGPTYCPECGAVHRDKRWLLDDHALRQMKEAGVKAHECAGCRMVREGLYDGILTLRWEGMTELQGSDVENLVRHEVERER